MMLDNDVDDDVDDDFGCLMTAVRQLAGRFGKNNLKWVRKWGVGRGEGKRRAWFPGFRKVTWRLHVSLSFLPLLLSSSSSSSLVCFCFALDRSTFGHYIDTMLDSRTNGNWQWLILSSSSIETLYRDRCIPRVQSANNLEGEVRDERWEMEMRLLDCWIFVIWGKQDRAGVVSISGRYLFSFSFLVNGR